MFKYDEMYCINNRCGNRTTVRRALTAQSDFNSLCVKTWLKSEISENNVDRFQYTG